MCIKILIKVTFQNEAPIIFMKLADSELLLGTINDTVTT